MKIIVTGESGIGKTSLIRHLKREAPEYTYTECPGIPSDLDLLAATGDDGCLYVHLTEEDDEEKSDRLGAKHAAIVMSIFHFGYPSDAEDVWKDRARTILAWIKSREEE